LDRDEADVLVLRERTRGYFWDFARPTVTLGVVSKASGKAGRLLDVAAAMAWDRGRTGFRTVWAA
jgi:hypothetical protein